MNKRALNPWRWQVPVIAIRRGTLPASHLEAAADDGSLWSMNRKKFTVFVV
jgi:hypothetical protein